MTGDSPAGQVPWQDREEFCAQCGKRRRLIDLDPLVSMHEETRQYTCRRELPCLVREFRRRRRKPR